VLLLLVMLLPSLLGCACGGLSLLPLLSRTSCMPPPPRVTPSAPPTGTTVVVTVTVTLTHP